MKHVSTPIGIVGLTLSSLAMSGMAHSATTSLTDTYADIALATFSDSLTTAELLGTAVDELIESPSDATLEAARNAWLAARVPYQQSEVYRFGNALVDDWEGQVNAWPLDEGLIDYVDASYGTESDVNELYAANVIANEKVMIGGQEIDASSLTPDLLANDLQEAGGNEANVATGYHAIEFLLWGQDLNGTDAGAGERPATDFDTENCSNGNCDRRAEYLKAATDLLQDDLADMVALWEDDGEARVGLQEAGEPAVITTILTGMGSLSYGELAGERMRLGLMLHDPEEEHDCFADNTYNSHLYDALGIQNVYLGTYDGDTEVQGTSLSDKVAAIDADLDAEMRKDLDDTMKAMRAMAERGETIEAYDQMIGEGNDEGNAVVQAAIDGLVKQTRTVERVVTALGTEAIAIEGSDSLDNPDSVFQ